MCSSHKLIILANVHQHMYLSGSICDDICALDERLHKNIGAFPGLKL